MEKSSKVILDNIEKYEKEDKYFMCFFVLPWENSQAFYNFRDKKEFFIDAIFLERLDHVYFDISKRVYEKSPFNTHVIVAGTSKARILYTKDIREELITNFKSENT